MQNLKRKQVGEEIKFSGFTQKTTKFYKEKGTINISQLDKIVEAMKRVAKQEKKNLSIVRIYVVNGDKRASYKNLQDFEDYYEGRVKDAEKFHEFFQVDITTAVN